MQVSNPASASIFKMQIEKHNGNYIVCGHIFSLLHIKPGQKWQGSGNYTVVIDKVDPERDIVFYSWEEKGETKSHSKQSFAFQCKYFLIVDVIEGDELESVKLNGPFPKDKINARLFDLVRVMRGELHEEDLIDMHEYVWLSGGSSLNKGPGSPSPRRLEEYDDMRERIKMLEEELEALKISLY